MIKGSSGIVALLLSAICVFSPLSGSAAEIERIEPPFWWQGFVHRELQLLVHGGGIADYEPSITHDGITISRVQRASSNNYLFVWLAIDASTPAGDFLITFSNDGTTLTHRYSLLERNADAAHIEGFSSDDVIYLITPDRFANGDPGNDSIEGYGDLPDRSEPYGRHGGDLAGIRKNLGYIADMGFTSIWLNPVLENAMPESSYHGYATTDFYRVDPRFGSNEDYRQLAIEAQQHGIGLIMDMIVNHAGIGHWWVADLPAPDWINFDGEFHPTNHARTTNLDPYASEYDKTEFANGWFAPTMPDLNQRNPLLAEYLIQNAIWWSEYLGLAGIRQDTYPYPDKAFMTEWTRRIMQEYPDFNIVGEEWSPNPAIVSYWQAGKKNHDAYESYLPGVFDFPLQIALTSVLTADDPPWGSAWTPVYEMLGNDFLYPDPSNLVIFPDNHDMSRIFTQLNEDYDAFRMAMAFNLTMRGIPQIFYGTEILMSHPGTDSHGVIRSDFPGGWAGDAVNAFTGAGLSVEAKQAQMFLRRLLNWRKSANVIHSGKLMQFAPIKNVYAYFRYNDDDVVMVIFNRDRELQTLDMSRFSERVSGRQTATDIITGKRFNIARDLVLEPRSVLILELDD
ncbi:MAG: glycoside hydrolase family 13 protein [Woeseiaceae bacterium]|nr:glycoside hydrolase family 13 protein [Woeseiaceae bacterium]